MYYCCIVIVGVLARYGGVASFVFAYQGQSMFLEIMKEMRNPAEFGRSVWVSITP